MIQDLPIAGMPMLFPVDVEMVLRLKQGPYESVQAISFFVVCYLLAILIVKVLWNVIAADFESLPRLTFLKAGAMLTAWSLLFVIVLTMISGARELMTPGAWEKQGATYSLKEDVETPSLQAEQEMSSDTDSADWTLKPFEIKEAVSSESSEKASHK